MSPDLTMLVPADRFLSPAEASCGDLDAILPRLRDAAVRTILAVDELSHPELEPDGLLAPDRIAPLAVHIYRLRDPKPRVEASGSARVVEARFGANDVSLVVSSAPASVLLRDGWAQVDRPPRREARAPVPRRASPVDRRSRRKEPSGDVLSSPGNRPGARGEWPRPRRGRAGRAPQKAGPLEAPEAEPSRRAASEDDQGGEGEAQGKPPPPREGGGGIAQLDLVPSRGHGDRPEDAVRAQDRDGPPVEPGHPARGIRVEDDEVAG
jgi:hypothetical protein